MRAFVFHPLYAKSAPRVLAECGNARETGGKKRRVDEDDDDDDDDDEKPSTARAVSPRWSAPAFIRQIFKRRGRGDDR